MGQRLFIVSSRLPVVVDKIKGIQPSSGSLVTAVSSYLKKMDNSTDFAETFWAGIPGCTPATWSELERQFNSPSYTFLPVFVKEQQYYGFYNGHSNSMIWPLFHYFPSNAEYNSEDYEQYKQVNEQFFQILIRQLRPTDIVWIHDHHLLLLASMLRKAIPELTIGFFLHIPFPSYEVIRLMPRQWQEELLEGMMGADLIGFHTIDYATHFLKCIQMVLGTDHEKHTFRYQDRLVKIDVFPDRKIFVELPDTIRKGLEMPEEEQYMRIQSMQSRIADYDVIAWANDFMNELNQIKKRQKDYQVKFLDEYTKRSLLDDFRKAQKRLLLLDYDGTLVSFSPDPLQAIPNEQLIALLDDLTTESNTIFLISGRNNEWLEKYFGQLNINIVSEHGARFRIKGQAWTDEITVQGDWKEQVERIMQSYVHRCPRSFTEKKNFSMVWHFRNSNLEEGKLRAAEMLAELSEFVAGRDLHVVMGNKILEVRNSGVDKGSAIRKIMAKEQFDFILAIGDDTTDEDMFKELAPYPQSYTIKVGSDASYAKYNLHTPQMVISLLESMNQKAVRNFYTSHPK